MQRLVLLDHAVELDAYDGVGVLLLAQARAHHLPGQHQPVDLDASRRGTRTGADDRPEDQQDNGERGPRIGVGRGESRGGHHRHELEHRIAERRRQRGVEVRGIEAHGDQHTPGQQHPQVPARHLRAENVVALAGHRRVDQSEMDTGRGHREDQDRVDHRAVEIGHAGVLGRKSARGAGRHGVAQRVEPVHARHFEHYGRKDRQPHVDHQQNLHDDLRPVAVVVLGHRRELHVGEHHLAAAHRRQDHQREHHHAHTADPGRGHTPELQSARQGLDIVQDRRSGGREARNALEPRIDQRELPAPDQVGEHRHDAGHEPRPHDDAEALLVGDLLALLDENQRKSAQQGREQRGEKQGIECRIHAAEVGNSRRKQHERRNEEHHDSHIP